MAVTLASASEPEGSHSLISFKISSGSSFFFSQGSAVNGSRMVSTLTAKTKITAKYAPRMPMMVEILLRSSSMGFILLGLN
jgi:hypothetical protein